MELGAAGLSEQPFRTHGRPLAVVSYASWRDALKVLEATCTAPLGLCLLQGPPLSGKSTLIREFVEHIPDDCAAAVVDGNGLGTAGLIEAALRQFGYVLDHSSTSELLAMLRVFAMQQAASHEAPILIVERVQRLNPSALRVLAELAALRFRGAAALKLVLVSDRSLASLVASPDMEGVRSRVTHDFHLRPMTSAEAREFLYRKLRKAGSESPDRVFPRAVCNALWRASGGWPGILDRIALLALAGAESLPVPAEVIETPALPRGTWLHRGDDESAAGGAPALFVTLDGQLLQELAFDQPRLLIGRSEHNDVAIASRFISRHHAILVRHGSSTFLMDLNSTNGTFVNSRRISNHVLADNDVITLGHHRIKYSEPNAPRRDLAAEFDFADTAIMKTLDDMRRLLAEENTELLPMPTENLPTSGLG